MGKVGNNFNYEEFKEKQNKARSEASASARDIGDIPPIVDIKRREKCQDSFRLFCETYFKEAFCLEWSKDHLKVIDRMEKCVKDGGLFTLAMSRGSGKSSLCKALCIYSLLYGYRNCVFLIAASEKKAQYLVKDIKFYLSKNPVLAEDFPEVCYPIQKLGGIVLRTKGQTYKGENTEIEWTQKELVLPTIDGSISSGACIIISGITGDIRGYSKTMPDQSIIRPDLFILDDPQTDESAKSVSQVEDRLGLIYGAICGLAGSAPDTPPISGVIPCTVICKDDVADQLLNTNDNPEFQGEKLKMVYKFPENDHLWSKYKEVYLEGYRQNKGLAPATEFYIANKEELEKGSEVAWEQKYDFGEASALQHAMNLMYRNEKAFFSEYQNEPLVEGADAIDRLTVDDIILRKSGINQREVPAMATHLTMAIDVGADKLHYTILALGERFAGTVIDYGVYPEGTKKLRDDGGTVEASIMKGLMYLDQTVVRQRFNGKDGGYKVGRCLIDTRYKGDVVAKFIETNGTTLYMQSMGQGYDANKVPISQMSRKKGRTIGHNWYIERVKGQERVSIDTNRWKSESHKRFMTPLGEPGAITVWGNNQRNHYEWAVAVAKSETPVRQQGKRSGIVMDIWKHNPGRENHWFDTYVYALVAGSVLGLRDEYEFVEKKKKRKRVSFAEKYKERHG